MIKERLLEGVAEMVFATLEFSIRTFSRVGDACFFDVQKFPWIPQVESLWDEISSELEEILKEPHRVPNFQDVSVEQKMLTTDNKWKSYFLYAYGHKIADNCEQCPATTRAVEGIPGIRTAFFSILEPGKYIPPHRGPFNGVLRYHLALRVPGEAGQCRIRVGEEVRPWILRQSLVFDDSYEHEAWNDSDGVRVVLFVDFDRPLPSLMAAINTRCIEMLSGSLYVKRGVANILAHNERLAADKIP